MQMSGTKGLGISAILIVYLSGGTSWAADTDALSQRIHKLATASSLGGMRVGIKIEQLGPHHSVIYEQNSQEAYQPASNQKLITSAAAMSLLSPNFTYRTVLGQQGDNLV